VSWSGWAHIGGRPPTTDSVHNGLPPPRRAALGELHRAGPAANRHFHSHHGFSGPIFCPCYLRTLTRTGFVNRPSSINYPIAAQTPWIARRDRLPAFPDSGATRATSAAFGAAREPEGQHYLEIQ